MHGNIAVFIPHLGCPHACSFCDQKSISGVERPVTPGEVSAFLEEAFSRRPDPASTEIAFFGGSFTCIPRMEMEAFLRAAEPFVKAKACTGIRISTRPDGISREVLELLGSCGVTAIELGAQSLDDGVLFRNGRGHTAEDVRRAVAAIRESRFRFSLGLQIMAGLHGDSREIWERTVEEVLQLKPDTLRIYPTVVLRGTGLEQLTREGLYTPLTVEEAVDWVAPVLPRLEAAGIRVIRVGLHASRSLEERLVAGAYHPAFRELCQGRLYREKLAAELEKYPPGTALELFAAPRELSKAAGQKRENLRWAEERGYRLKLRPDEELAAGELRISPKTP